MEWKWLKPAPPIPVVGSFYCRGCGTCCHSFVVHVTHFDVYRIVDHTGMAPQDFLQLALPDHAREPEAFAYIYQRRCLALKHQALDAPYTCIFLKNDLCGIHSHKPGVCQTWPLDFDRDGNVNWIKGHLAFMRRNCAFKSSQPDDPASFYQDILVYNFERRLFRQLIEEWNTLYESRTQAEEFVLEATETHFIEYFMARRSQEEEKKAQWLIEDKVHHGN